MKKCVKSSILTSFIFLFVSFSALGEVASVNNQGGFLETVTLTDQAWLGSAGSIFTNPSLLAWHSDESRFTSTNAILAPRSHGPQPKDASTVDVAPFLIPIYAGTTNRNGDWAIGYAISTFKYEGPISQTQEELRLDGRFSNSRIDAALAVAHRVGKWAIGTTFTLTQHSSESSMRYHGDSSGFEYIGAGKNEQQFWSTGMILGMAYEYTSTLAFGLSMSHPLVIWGARGEDSVWYYSEVDNQLNIQNDKTTPRVGSRGLIKAGARWQSDLGILSMDIGWNSGSRDQSGEDQEYTYPSYGIVFGGEWQLPWDGKSLLAGLQIDEAERIKNSSFSTEASGIASLGVSWKEKVSQSFIAVSMARELEVLRDETLALKFGTNFGY